MLFIRLINYTSSSVTIETILCLNDTFIIAIEYGHGFFITIIVINIINNRVEIKFVMLPAPRCAFSVFIWFKFHQYDCIRIWWTTLDEIKLKFTQKNFDLSFHFPQKTVYFILLHFPQITLILLHPFYWLKAYGFGRVLKLLSCFNNLFIGWLLNYWPSTWKQFNSSSITLFK